MINALPTIGRSNDIAVYLKKWQTTLNRVLKTANSPKAPWNFTVTNAQGGFQLSWSPVVGSDGYQILRSSSGDFSNPEAVIIISGQNQSKFFDHILAGAGSLTVTKFYKIRATNGIPHNPQSVLGVLSGIVSHTSLANNDTTTVPTTISDTTTTDKTQIAAGRAKRILYTQPLLRPPITNVTGP